MDFFEAQELARKKTKLLVFYFVLAVLGIVVAVYALLVVVTALGGSETDVEPLALWQPGLLAAATVGSLAVISLGSGFKVLQLAAGGERVAKELGGRRVSKDTVDPDERRLLNVVEEMAIASGTAVPDVYVLEDEEGINAFAAGYSPSDAVIGVTRGCMQALSRDELQGVIAHEFSHVLNGDMRLNIRLMGLLFGIVMMTVIGRIVLRSGAHGSSSNRKNNGAAAILAFGLGLVVIGSIGVFFARLIQAAVSRQREYLADASAVQFTRLPAGIAGALKKIGGVAQGSRIQDPHAEEASHMFFADGLARHLGSALATHPPLPLRIRALEPDWDGRFIPPGDVDPALRLGRAAPRRGTAVPAAAPLAAPVSALAAESRAASGTAAAVPAFQSPNDAQMTRAAQLRAGLPAAWLTRASRAPGAVAGLFGLLLSRNERLRQDQIRLLADRLDPELVADVTAAHEETRGLNSEQRLALVDLAIPALRRLTSAEYALFVETTQKLVESDSRVDLFEFTLEKILHRHLDLYFQRRPPPDVRYGRLRDVATSASVLLSALAWVGARGDAARASHAFEAGVRALERTEPATRVALASQAECGLRALGSALDQLDHAGPLLKKALLEACGAVVLADGVVLDQEAELIRAIADSLGAPLPLRVATTSR
jgi:Zn-dependent protease with chaperone function